MSLSHQENIRCSRCGLEALFTVWDSINVTVDSALKESLLKGDVTRFRCGGCGHEALVASDCLYHDMDRALQIWLRYPDDDEVREETPSAKSLLSAFAPNYLYRSVASFNELLDKISVFDDHLSDYEVELLKLINCIREGIDISIPFHYSRIESSWFWGKSLVFVLEVEDGFVERRYPMDSQLGAVKSIMPRLRSVLAEASEEWPRIDRAFMLSALQGAGLMRMIA